ncbi:hypothetical protein E4U32_005571 [Claviceps aff. humidiphila group G2b]|nr:hypothetical protein E4U32_005571 [Claviceps aff. humidiphila group G2b]
MADTERQIDDLDSHHDSASDHGEADDDIWREERQELRTASFLYELISKGLIYDRGEFTSLFSPDVVVSCISTYKSSIIGVLWWKDDTLNDHKREDKVGKMDAVTEFSFYVAAPSRTQVALGAYVS